MAKITTSWTKIKEVYCGWDGYHDVYWRMYARISAQSESNTTVSVEGRLYISGNAGSFSSWATTTCGGNVGNYSSWGQSAEGAYYVGETTIWSGSDTTSGTSIPAGVRFYSSPWGWTGENLYLSDTLTFDPATSPPAGLTVGLSEVYTNGAKFNVSISSYGIPNNASGRYIEAAILAQSTYGATYKYNIASNVSSSAITVTNASTRGTLTIRPNTQYYYGAYASNTQRHVSKVQGQFVTKAEAPTVELFSAKSDSATFSYSVSADGGYYNRTIQYSLNNGATWRNGATVSSGAAKTGTFVVNGLLAGTTYNMLIRVSTQAGTTDGESVPFDTLVGEEDNKNIFYGSAGGVARECQVLYGSVNSEATPIIKLYGAAPDPNYFNVTIVHGTEWAIRAVSTQVLNEKLESAHPEVWGKRAMFKHIKIDSVPQTPRRYTMTMIYNDNSEDNLGSGNESWLNEYGFLVRDFPPYAQNRPTRDFIKLKNRTIKKLCYQAFGHVDYS